MKITTEAAKFLKELLQRRKKTGVRIGYNDNSKWGSSKFKLTLDECNHDDTVIIISDIHFLYNEEVITKHHRLHITYENGRLSLKDSEKSIC